MRRRIPQYKARAALKRVEQLKDQLRAQRTRVNPQWIGTTLDWLNVSEAEAAVVRTAQRCEHAVVVIADERKPQLRIIALPHRQESI